LSIARGRVRLLRVERFGAPISRRCPTAFELDCHHHLPSQGQNVITDGPFAETKEILAGYRLVECKNLDEAIALGERFPGLRVGLTIEVRPLMNR
jgi:hypothetical protein